MDLAAVVVASAAGNFAAHQAQPCLLRPSRNSKPIYSSRVPILGNDVLLSWMQRIRKLGVSSLWLTPSFDDENGLCSALAGLARQGIDRLLMIKLESYAEIDLFDLVRFHREKHNSVTEAQDTHGQLGVSLVNHEVLESHAQTFASDFFSTESQTPYSFSGYAKRISSSKERQELVGDGLTGACAMRPLGKQASDKVWIAEGAELADSVRVVGPAYIGANTVVRAGATIGPFTSVERECVVDCGTTVERSTVLPQTYVGPGLLIRQALVDGGRLENLRLGTVADLQPAGLGSRVSSRESRTFDISVDPISRPGKFFPHGAAHVPDASNMWQQVRL